LRITDTASIKQLLQASSLLRKEISLLLFLQLAQEKLGSRELSLSTSAEWEKRLS